MTDTAVLSVLDALAFTISQGANPPVGPNGPILGSPRFYRDKAPANAPLGYFILGQTAEQESGFLNGQAGQAGRYRIHCWSNSSANAIRMYQWLKPMIHDRILVLDGHHMVRGQLSLVTTQSDADGFNWQVVADYTVESLEG